MISAQCRDQTVSEFCTHRPFDITYAFTMQYSIHLKAESEKLLERFLRVPLMYPCIYLYYTLGLLFRVYIGQPLTTKVLSLCLWGKLLERGQYMFSTSFRCNNTPSSITSSYSKVYFNKAERSRSS